MAPLGTSWALAMANESPSSAHGAHRLWALMSHAGAGDVYSRSSRQDFAALGVTACSA
jgi:hypothetical protein